MNETPNKATMSILIEGQSVGSTYVVERFLGEGAFAEVYRVQHRFLGRQAMKVLKQRGMELSELEKTLSEAILLSKIGHPNIIRVFDANITTQGDSTIGYFTMEYVPGGSLDNYWKSYQDTFMPIKQAVDVLTQVCTGLTVAHSESPPIIHRDIKPQNILIGYNEAGMIARLADFGLAKQVNALTLLASCQGTLGFKPPESFKNMDSCAADVWAIGTTLYLLLTNVLPYPSLEDRDISDAHRFLNTLRPASLYNLNVDPLLDSIVNRCLARDPNCRYPNATVLLEDLNKWKQNSIAPNNVRANPTEEAYKGSSERKEDIEVDLCKIVKNAIELSKHPGKLHIAADMLEEAISKDRTLRDKYESQLKLWRKGMCM